MEKKFLLGVGCAKGGTTWLSHQVRKSKSANLGFFKEYHVFDDMFVPNCNISNSRRKMLESSIKAPEFLEDKSNTDLLRLMQFHIDVGTYFEYFESLCNESSSIELVGDITPGYAILPVEGFDFIRNELIERGFSPKVIFLMRDPVDRALSWVRMISRNNNKILSKDEEILRLREEYFNPDIFSRNDYKSTIINLESSFEKEEIYYGFYETLFSKDSSHSIKKFLDLDDFSTSSAERVNSSNKSYDHIPADLRSEISRYYSETLDFCNEKFQLKNQGIWSSYDYL